ncbi:H/ACA ribonucleoprotein complex subunit GAR1 [Nosema granulosis]|uniref:H/ACA ribonucleoprotein complex subunit n=1 Tax=Nosema granulosis TaxID=83296 RepID=A0A9P6KZ15_9MICR|nr:H/ACA ribonucleoprotein complex subunit GAR1 [Nosema granulosis]
MNSKFKNKKFRNNKSEFNGKPKELGKFLHMCEDLVVVKLTGSDIPFPNAHVLNSDNKVIGKVEEVLGPQNEVYAAIKLDSLKEKYEDGTFYCYENKFIPKERFMVRSEVEKKKEEGDKKKGQRGDPKRKGDFNKRDNNKRDFNKRDGGFKKRDNTKREGGFIKKDGNYKKFKK